MCAGGITVRCSNYNYNLELLYAGNKQTVSLIKMVLRTLLTLFCIFRVTAVNDSGEIDHNGAEIVWGKVGGDAMLPCDISVPYPGDRVSMVLWFKDSTAMPLYSLDFRSGPLIHWATTDDLGARSHFVLDEGRPDDAHLAIKGVAAEDKGVFRCRVDFFDSPTKNFKVNLSLIEPPNDPRIFDGQGREIAGIAGPFREGYDLYLACQVTGGKPSPEVSWWHNDRELESLQDPTSPPGTVTKQLFISTVTRQYYAAKIQCRAQSSDLLHAVVKEVQLQVYLKPMIIHIVTPNELLAAGKPQAMRCETIGSYPAARLSWLLDGEVIRSHPVTVTTTGNTTSSILTMILNASDDGKDLTCRATNPWFPGGVLEDSRTINVAFSPKVTLTIGSNEDPGTLKEGAEVQLICNTDARPPVDKYAWYRGGELLHHNPADGLVVLGRTMRIRNLTKDDSGNYTCKAANSEGNAKSQILTIKVLYVPMCRAGAEPKEIAALKNVPVSLRCEVDSPPEAGPVKFSWTYNKTRDVLPIPASRANNIGTVSELLYTPQITGDYGTLACWATSSAGHQKQPCLFNIIPAKIPEPPQECSLVNGSKTLEVVCVPGADGGIPQHFVLEVLAESKSINSLEPLPEVDNEISTMNDQGVWIDPQVAPLYRETGGEPRFQLHGLRPGKHYGILIYAENARGRSYPAKLRDVTISEELASPDKFYNIESKATGPGDLNNDLVTSQPMAMILGGLVASAVLIILAIFSAAAVVICKRRGNCGSDRNKRESLTSPSMYAAPDDENGFPMQYNTSSVMIRPCADIRRDARRTSRALSALQEEALAAQEISIIGHDSEDIELKPGVRINPDIYAPPQYPSNCLNSGRYYSDQNMYAPMIPTMNYQETGIPNYQITDPQRLYRTSSGRNYDYAIYAQGFGMNMDQNYTNPNSQYARLPLQNIRPTLPDIRMSTLERRRNLQGIPINSQGVRTDPIRRLSLAPRDPGIPYIDMPPNLMMNPMTGSQKLDIVQIGPDNSLLRVSRSDCSSERSATSTPQIYVQEFEGSCSMNQLPLQTVAESAGPSVIVANCSSAAQTKDEDPSGVVRFVENKPDLLISQKKEELSNPEETIEATKS